MGIQLHMASKQLGTLMHICWKPASARPNHKAVPGPWQFRKSSWSGQGSRVRDVPDVPCHEGHVEEPTLFQQSYFAAQLTGVTRPY